MTDFSHKIVVAEQPRIARCEGFSDAEPSSAGVRRRSDQLMNRLIAEGGPYLPVVVLQHELGHRANNLDGEKGVVERSEENQADCEAGSSTRYAYKAGRLPRANALKSALLLFQLGDVSNFGDETADDPGVHGSPPQRVISYGRGYFQGFGACYDVGRDRMGRSFRRLRRTVRPSRTSAASIPDDTTRTAARNRARSSRSSLSVTSRERRVGRAGDGERFSRTRSE